MINLEQLAWFNQQLAAMLREGLPLGGALRQLTTAQQAGALREEFLRLETALGQGIPLGEAVAAGRLPPLYVRLVQAGAKTGDLAGALTMAADHYGEMNALWRRTKALLVYPALVILIGFGLTLLLGKIHRTMLATFGDVLGPQAMSSAYYAGLALVPLVFAAAGTGLGILLLLPPTRSWLAWRIPGFRESRSAHLAGALALLLRHGCPLPEALALVSSLEGGNAGGQDLERWRSAIAAGQTDFADNPAVWKSLPPILSWFIRSGGENLGQSLERAAAFLRQRAHHHLDLMLHAALPLLLVCLGFLVSSQVFVVFRLLVPLIDSLGGME